MIFRAIEDGLKFRIPGSPWPVFLSDDLAWQLGGPEGVEMALCDAENQLGLMPRTSSAQAPWTPLDWSLMHQNMVLGYRHWRYNPSRLIGRLNYHGYGYCTSDGFQFWDFTTNSPNGLPVPGINPG